MQYRSLPRHIPTQIFSKLLHWLASIFIVKNQLHPMWQAAGKLSM